MEGISDEYFNRKQQEIINFYKDPSKEDPEINTFFEKYINLLKLCQALGSPSPLVRDRGRESFGAALQEVEAYRPKVGSELLEVVVQELIIMIEMMMNSLKWEGKAGALTAATFILESYNCKDLEDKTFRACFDLLFKKEFPLLQSILNYIKAYTQKHGPDCFQEVQQRISASLDEHWAKYDNLIEEEEQSQKANEFPAFSTNVKELFKVRSDINLTLDSLYKVLLVFIDTMPENSKLLDGHLLQLIYKAGKHTKQEVRILGCEVIAKVLTKIPQDLWKENIVNIGNLIIYSMSDDFTTVRHQATKSIFSFVDRAAIDNSLNQFTPMIVPRILINRYHPASALSDDSITLWKTYLEKIGMAGKGRDVLSSLANDACEFYLMQLKQNHHEILKAACLALNELVTKVEGSAQAVSTHFNEILDLCFTLARHENPIVRTSSFKILEGIVSACPEESRKRLEEIIDIGFFQICFNFKSEDIADSVALYLAAVYRTFQQDLHSTFVEKVKEHLSYYTKEEEIVQVKEERDPIVFKGELIRPKAFEVATGALILLTRLIPIKVEIIEPNLELLHNIVQLRNANFTESVMCYAWRVFQRAFSTWTDKKVIKREVEVILEPLFRDVNSSKETIAEEASAVIKTIVEKIGINIFKARVENVFGDMYSKLIDKIMS